MIKEDILFEGVFHKGVGLNLVKSRRTPCVFQLVRSEPSFLRYMKESEYQEIKNKAQKDQTFMKQKWINLDLLTLNIHYDNKDSGLVLNWSQFDVEKKKNKTMMPEIRLYASSEICAIWMSQIKALQKTARENVPKNIDQIKQTILTLDFKLEQLLAQSKSLQDKINQLKNTEAHKLANDCIELVKSFKLIIQESLPLLTNSQPQQVFISESSSNLLEGQINVDQAYFVDEKPQKVPINEFKLEEPTNERKAGTLKLLRSNYDEFDGLKLEELKFQPVKQSNTVNLGGMEVEEVVDEEEIALFQSIRLSMKKLKRSESIIVNNTRTELPFIKEPEPKLSFIKLFTSSSWFTQKDLKIPVFYNEPLSILQKIASTFEYANILTNAATADSSERRILLIATFVISQFANIDCIFYKPFSPLLGETFEYTHQQEFSFIAEQVSLNPSITAWECKSLDEKWKMWGQLELEAIGLSLKQVKPVFLQFGKEVFRVKYPTVIAKNLNSMFTEPEYELDLAGKAKIERIRDLNGNQESTLSFVIDFEIYNSGYFTKQKIPNQCQGQMYHNGTNYEGKIEGSWNKELQATFEGITNLIWVKNKTPDNFRQNYGMNQFSLQLNFLVESKVYALTDSRYRPDQRAIEEGEIILAEQKNRILEENQRLRGVVTEYYHGAHRTKWFQLQKCQYDEELYWQFETQKEEIDIYNINESNFKPIQTF